MASIVAVAVIGGIIAAVAGVGIGALLVKTIEEGIQFSAERAMKIDKLKKHFREVEKQEIRDVPRSELETFVNGRNSVEQDILNRLILGDRNNELQLDPYHNKRNNSITYKGVLIVIIFKRQTAHIVISRHEVTYDMSFFQRLSNQQEFIRNLGQYIRRELRYASKKALEG